MSIFREIYYVFIKYIYAVIIVSRSNLNKLMGPKPQVRGAFVTPPMLFSGAFLQSVAVSHVLLTAFMFGTSLSATYQP